MSGVIVVGSVNVDLVVHIDVLPGPGQTVTGGRLAQHHGGKGGNAAVAAARWGADVRFFGAVGDDEHGAAARQALLDEGIDVSGLIELDEATGVALIVVDAAGENQIAVAPGANAALEGRHLAGLVVSSADVCCANLEISDEVILEAGRRCTSVGARFVLDPAPARALSSAIYELGPVLVPNLGEAEMLSGHHGAEAAAQALHERTGAPVVVTLGSQGALLVDGGSATALEVPAVEAVDATGAGDTFCGVLAAELAASRGVAEAVGSACRAAASSVTRRGARDGMPRRMEARGR